MDLPGPNLNRAGHVYRAFMETDGGDEMVGCEMNDNEFLTAFENCTLPAERWTHGAHVRVAYMYASRNSLRGATDKMRSSIKAYAKARNTPDTIDQGYHETITAAFMRLVFAANLQTGPYQSPQDFCKAHPQLLDNSVLRCYYSRDHMMTWEAKAKLIAPDLRPLPIVIGDSLTICNVTEGDALAVVRKLFTEYAQSLDYKLCFHDFDEELSGLPGQYGLPNGRLFLAYDNYQPAGCVALRPSGDGSCEMKRLWVRPQFRRTGLGQHLTTAATGAARDAGYSAIQLKSAASMEAAIALYQSRGFVLTKPCSDDPEPGVQYMKLDLHR